jgi:outer membrane receptor protein involved in Fe transport
VNDPVTGLPLADKTFRADSLKSYEAGFRTETSDRAISLDVAAYHIDWNDIQVSTAAGGVAVIANAGRAKVDGGELTLIGRPTAAITATGSFAYQHARLSEDSPELGATAGERLPNVPKFTAALGFDWRGGSALRPTVGATLRHVGARDASFDANPGFPQYHLPAYTAVDVRAGVSLGQFDLTAYVRNVFDVRGQLSAQTVLSTAGGPAQVSMLQPRTIGLTASKHF